MAGFHSLKCAETPFCEYPTGSVVTFAEGAFANPSEYRCSDSRTWADTTACLDFDTDAAMILSEVLLTNTNGRACAGSTIVGIGDEECTAVFHADVNTIHNIRWADWDLYDGFTYQEDTFDHYELVYGTVKLQYARDPIRITDTTYTELDYDELEIGERPWDGY